MSAELQSLKGPWRGPLPALETAGSPGLVTSPLLTPSPPACHRLLSCAKSPPCADTCDGTGGTPRLSVHLKTLNLITSAKTPFPSEATLTVPGIWMGTRPWVGLGEISHLPWGPKTRFGSTGGKSGKSDEDLCRPGSRADLSDHGGETDPDAPNRGPNEHRPGPLTHSCPPARRDQFFG